MSHMSIPSQSPSNLQQEANVKHLEKLKTLNPADGIKISLISLHGLIRATIRNWAATRIRAVKSSMCLELARELAASEHVREVELLTRQIVDPKVDDSYAQIEEEICANARIVRIPFGPKRYLRKEALWPYIEMFVDQTLVHFRRTGIPDILHAHYADAGLAGSQLATLLHVPFIFTGHSLGRVEEPTLIARSKRNAEGLNKKYNFDCTLRGRGNGPGNRFDGRHQYQPRSRAAI